MEQPRTHHLRTRLHFLWVLLCNHENLRPLYAARGKVVCHVLHVGWGKLTIFAQTGWGTRAGIGDASAATAAADKLNAEEEKRQHKVNDNTYSFNSNEDNIIAERRRRRRMINKVEDDDDRYKRVGTLLDPSPGPSSSLGARHHHPLHNPSSSNPLGLGYAASSTAHVESTVYVDDDPSPPWTSSPPPAQFYMAGEEEEEKGKTTAADLNFAKNKQQRPGGGERERWKVPPVPGGPRSRPVGRQGSSQQQTGRRVIEEWV